MAQLDNLLRLSFYYILLLKDILVLLQLHLKGYYLNRNGYVIRSYHSGITRSHPNSEVKHYWACLVLRWGTTREP